MKVRSIFILFMFFLYLFDLPAQNSANSSTDVTYIESSYFLSDLGFASDAVFMGRVDSIPAPYLFPSFTYFNKSGFFASTSLSFLTKKDEQRVDLIWLSAGYMYDKKKFSTGISATAYLYSDYSYNVQSQMLGAIWAYVAYDFKIVNLTLTGSSNFTKDGEVDFFTGAILDHAFFALDSSLIIAPGISLYGGTQNFYEQYYNNGSSGKPMGNGGSHGSSGQGGSDSSIYINEVSKFNILNIELSLPIQYYYKSFIFSFTPSYAFPQSPSTFIYGESIVEEELNNVFYFYVGVGYWFFTNKKKR